MANNTTILSLPGILSDLKSFTPGNAEDQQLQNADAGNQAVTRSLAFVTAARALLQQQSGEKVERLGGEIEQLQDEALQMQRGLREQQQMQSGQ